MVTDLSDESLEAAARALYAMDEDVAVDGTNVAMIFDANTHRGDCTNEAWTCPVCLADEYRLKVTRIVQMWLTAERAQGRAIVAVEDLPVPESKEDTWIEDDEPW